MRQINDMNKLSCSECSAFQIELFVRKDTNNAVLIILKYLK